jgi:glycosyltransferase involved in cell wall biosynthesis
MRKLSVLLLGPVLTAVSGVSTHLNQLFGSSLSETVRLTHFRVGSEGVNESKLIRMFRLIVSPFHLLLILAVHRPHIVHINTSLNPKAFWRDIIYLFVARSFGRRVVYQIHGGDLPEDFCRHGGVSSSFLRWVLSLPRAVVLLAQSESRAYGVFAPGVHLIVIPNAIDANRITAMARRSPTDAALQLTYLGRLVDTKGVLDVVEAVNILHQKGIDVRLVIAGTGPAEAQLRSLIAEHALADRVVLCDPVFGAAKDNLWLETDVFPFPTYHPEGLPYALLESMAAGAVPVTCSVGAAPDVMEDGVHGLFVPPRDPAALADAVARLNADRQELARMSIASRGRILDRFAIDRLAREFASLYESI